MLGFQAIRFRLAHQLRQPFRLALRFRSKTLSLDAIDLRLPKRFRLALGFGSSLGCGGSCGGLPRLLGRLRSLNFGLPLRFLARCNQGYYAFPVQVARRIKPLSRLPVAQTFP